MALSFIHCADLHIGTPFKGVAERCTADKNDYSEILRAPEKALKKIIDTALKEKVDFVLFAGDIMDSVNVNWRSISILSQAFLELKQNNITPFVIAGNHDALPSAALENACKNAVLFNSDAISSFEIPGKAIIHGISFTASNSSKNIAKDFKRTPSALFQIALFHGNIGGQAGHDNYSPASLSDLINTNIDYWALGHIHEKSFLSQNSPVILYPGSTVSHHVNESSPKGFYLVKVDDFKHVSAEFIESGTINFSRLECDISSAETLNDVQKKVHSSVLEIPNQNPSVKYFIELILTGATVLDNELKNQNEEDLLFSICRTVPTQFRITGVNIKTAPLKNFDAFCNENIFGSDLHASFEQEKDADLPMLREEANVFKRTYGTLFELGDEDIKDIANEAENELICLFMEDTP